jgi:hypothetical protein
VTPDGLRVLIRYSKTDQEGQGQVVAIPRGYGPQPVETLQTRLTAAEISIGPVFRAVALSGRGLRRRPGGRQHEPHREAVCFPSSELRRLFPGITDNAQAGACAGRGHTCDDIGRAPVSCPSVTLGMEMPRRCTDRRRPPLDLTLEELMQGLR